MIRDPTTAIRTAKIIVYLTVNGTKKRQGEVNVQSAPHFPFHPVIPINSQLIVLGGIFSSIIIIYCFVTAFALPLNLNLNLNLNP